MSKRSKRNRVGLVLAVAICSALVAALPAGAAGGYTDATGDSGNAPDLAGVFVTSDDASGQVSFRIVELNPTAPDSVTELDIDSDANPATGETSSGGADYAFQISPSTHSYGFWHWNGSDWLTTPHTTVQITAFGTGFTISVNKSELGATPDFNFGAVTFTRSSDGSDSAPDDGFWNYSVQAHGPDIVSVLVATQPGSGPKAGKLFPVPGCDQERGLPVCRQVTDEAAVNHGGLVFREGVGMRGKARQLRLLIGCVVLVLLALATSTGNAAGAAKARLEAPTLAGLGYSPSTSRPRTGRTTRRLASGRTGLRPCLTDPS